MQVTKEHDHKIRKIMRGLQCQRDFECYASKFENLSKAGVIGDVIMVECIEEKAKTRKFGRSVGLGYICECALRNYIIRNFYR